MATFEGKDVLKCYYCPNSVEHHCYRCQVDLCSKCTSRHIADKTKRHEFVNKEEGPILPKCKSHEKKLCEMYCNDCHEAACALCITGKHKKHDFTDIESSIENFKKHINADMKKLDDMLTTQHKHREENKPSKVFDDALSNIQEQEDMICKEVREICNHLKIEVAKQKKHYEEKHKTMQSLSEKTEKELHEIIESDKRILQSNDAATILNYQPRNAVYHDWPKDIERPSVKFLQGTVNQRELQHMVGKIQTHDITSRKAWYNKSFYGATFHDSPTLQ